MKVSKLWFAHEGNRLPWWLGLAYWEHDSMTAVCLPIPLNRIVRWARGGYFWFKATRNPSWLDNHWSRAYEAGYVRGLKAGVKIGENHTNARLDEVQAKLDAWLDRDAVR
jgi:hypothetical protein